VPDDERPPVAPAADVPSSEDGNQAVLAELEHQIHLERHRLKEQLDELWSDDPSAARPVLADMQRLVNLLEEFSQLRGDVHGLLAVMQRLDTVRRQATAALLDLADVMDDWRRTRPRAMTDRLRAYLEEHDPSHRVVEALCFEADAELRILLDSAARLRHRHETHPSCHHLSDDAAEAANRRTGDPNEIPFSALFELPDGDGTPPPVVILFEGDDDGH